MGTRAAEKGVTGGVWELLRRGLFKQMGPTRDQLEFSIKIRAIFDGFDDDGSGAISGPELRKALKGLDIHVSAKEMNVLMARYDVNRDDNIDFDEFEEMVKELIPPPEFDIGGIFLEQKLMAMFEKMDENGDGTLDPDEIRVGLHTLGIDISDAHLERIVAAADQDGDGTVDFGEFCQMYSKYPVKSNQTEADLQIIANKWEPEDEIVKDSDEECKPGTKVMIRKQYRHQRGYAKMGGVGQLTRPVQGCHGRWYVAFPGCPETFFSTGRHGIHELTYVPNDPRAHDKRTNSLTNNDLFSKATSSKQSEMSLADFRTRLMLARFSTGVKSSEAQTGAEDEDFLGSQRSRSSMSSSASSRTTF